MALINCPECGREKVSDSAEMCPECGYGIKLHFEKIKYENEEKIRQQKEIEEKARKIEEQKVRQELVSERRIKSVPKPEKPAFSKGMRNYLIIASIWWVFFVLFIANVDWGLRLANGAKLVFITEIIPLLIYLFAIYMPKMSKYNLAQENFEEYQKQVVKEQDEMIKRQKAYSEAERIRQMNSPRCPVCNSTNVERISTTSRAVSIAAVGLASGKIGKQYKCKKCKHLW